MYLGEVLTDELSTAKDVEQDEIVSFKIINFVYHKLSSVDKSVMLHIFQLHAIPFYGAETW